MTMVVCVGVAVIDHIYGVPAIPREPVKVLANSYEEAGGGMSATGAVAICRLGGQAAMWSRVGEDDIGQRVIAGLAAEGVDTTGVRVFAGHQSTHATVFVDPQGERLLAGYRDLTVPDDPAWLPLADLAQADAVLADSSWPEGAIAVLRAARERALPSVLDCDMASDPQMTDVIALASHTIFSQPALQEFSGETDPGVGLRAVVGRAGGLIGVTAGEDGFYWLDDEASLRHMPAPQIDVVDTLGAGDVFHGAYALALAEGADPEHCARFATAAAALKCTKPGGRNGAPTRREVEAFLQQA